MAQPQATFIVRPCFQQDLEQVQLIYAHYVTTSTATFELAPPGLAEMETRWSEIVTKSWPYLVACPAQDLTRIAAFAYAHQFRSREGYAHTFEHAIYTAPQFQRRGVGRSLLLHLLHTLKDDGVREAIAAIGDSGNTASIGLHAALGFREIGVLRGVGRKFDRWLDVVLMQRSLRDSS